MKQDHIAGIILSDILNMATTLEKSGTYQPADTESQLCNSFNVSVIELSSYVQGKYMTNFLVSHFII